MDTIPGVMAGEDMGGSTRYAWLLQYPWKRLIMKQYGLTIKLKEAP